jgi:hypothetical protein
MKKANVQNLAVIVSKWPLLLVEVVFETWQCLATQSPTMSCENIVVQQLSPTQQRPTILSKI